MAEQTISELMAEEDRLKYPSPEYSNEGQMPMLNSEQPFSLGGLLRAWQGSRGFPQPPPPQGPPAGTQPGQPGFNPMQSGAFEPVQGNLQFQGAGGSRMSLKIDIPTREEFAQNAQDKAQEEMAKGKPGVGGQQPPKPTGTGLPQPKPTGQPTGVTQTAADFPGNQVPPVGGRPLPTESPPPLISSERTPETTSITGDMKDRLYVIDEKRKALSRLHPTYDQIMSQAAAQDHRSRFRRIMDSVLTQDPFYSDKLQLQRAQYELGRRQGMAQDEMRLINDEYVIREHDRITKAGFLQQQLNGNKTLRNNPVFLHDVARVNGLTDEQAKLWVESKFDKETGTYTMIKDPLQAASEHLTDMSTIYQNFFGMDKATARKAAIDPTYANKLNQDAEALIDKQLYDAIQQGGPEATKKIERFNQMKVKIMDAKNDNGLAVMREKIRVQDQINQDVQNSTQYSAKAKKEFQAHTSQTITNIIDIYTTRGRVTERNEADLNRKELQAQRQHEHRLAMLGKEEGRDLDNQLKALNLAEKKFGAHSTLDEIAIKADPGLAHGSKEEMRAVVGGYNETINAYTKATTSGTPWQPTPQQQQQVDIYTNGMASHIHPGGKDALDKELGRPFTTMDAVHVDEITKWAKSRTPPVVLTYAQIIAGLKERNRQTK